MGAAETRRALEAAGRAYPEWRSRTAKSRASILRRLADLMLDHQEDLARLLVTEQGKPLAEARTEIEYAASFYEWFGEEAKRAYGDTIPTPSTDRRILVDSSSPVGRDRGHHALELPGGDAARGRRLRHSPRAARWCCKPAEQTPLTALAVAELADEAGLPRGRALRGDRRCGGRARDRRARCTSNPLVRKLGFTGSTEVGKLLMRAVLRRS